MSLKSDKAREYRLKKIYGITLDQYNQLLAKQNFSCGVCRRHHSTFKTNLSVEHNHQTGEIRGLCCHYCNLRILGRHKTSELFHAAAKYLDGPYTGLFVPPKVKKKRKKQK